MVIKTLAKCLREYKKATIVTLVFIALEVLIEVLIPFFTADMVNMIKDGVPLGQVGVLGIKLTVMALASMSCGAIAARACAKAASGFARNVRRDMYVKVQDFSFADIRFEIDCDAPVEISLYDPDGNFVGSGDHFHIENPRLWWCNGQGEAAPR